MVEDDFPLTRSQAVEVLSEHLIGIDRGEAWTNEWRNEQGLSTRCLNCLAQAAVNGFFQNMTPEDLDGVLNGTEDYCAYSMGPRSEEAPDNFEPCKFIPRHTAKLN